MDSALSAGRTGVVVPGPRFRHTGPARIVNGVGHNIAHQAEREQRAQKAKRRVTKKTHELEQLLSMAYARVNSRATSLLVAVKGGICLLSHS